MFSIKPRKKISKEEAFQKRAKKQVRGRLPGKDYSAYIKIGRNEFSSHGRSQIMNDPVSEREHHFLSWLETFIWLLLLHLGAKVTCEQFPLSAADDDMSFLVQQMKGRGTLSIAELLEIKHPKVNDEVPRILTTDLIIESPRNEQCAIYVRPHDLVPKDGRGLELLRLQAAYWKERNRHLYVLTERHLDYQLIDLLIWSYTSRRSYPTGADKEFLVFLSDCNTYRPLKDQLKEWRGSDFVGDAVNQFKAAIFSGQVTVTLNEESGNLHPLNEPWKFAVLNEKNINTRLSRFFSKIEPYRA